MMGFCVFPIALQFYRMTDEVSADMEEMETELQGTGEKKQDNGGAANAEEKETLNVEAGNAVAAKSVDEFTMMKLLKSRALRMPLFIACFLQVIQQLSGINAVRLLICLSFNPVCCELFGQYIKRFQATDTNS